jgi:hypothetical protein
LDAVCGGRLSPCCFWDPAAPPNKDRWTAQADLSAAASDVLLALTDPDLIASWAPIQFDVVEIARRPATCRLP